ncbi:hypothetical protein [Candidatus Hamiltonella defensa]|uniref:Uncharacterized protein n=1 Tax=Hamiltonella defensa subsp. Acyrthosiphon pisum (strain 5AT) TaxID=572265 RepID=C4K685_HAMD5|nr:hypothetical protein [Candidatus Hamiltonella defensa]ACQ68078.1 hypothetical protein HDEF_1452 [Candidatus Hamiltonella defensa 5AT (Acyrthosiphon pisum)]ATW22687.1 hypothetical protein BJP44_06420 [Candidatus Hamiltonella defensa]
MARFRSIDSYAIQVSFKENDTQEEYISICEPVINNDFLNFTTVDRIECFIPTSRINYVKTFPIEKYSENDKVQSRKSHAFKINPESLNDLQNELKTFFNQNNQNAKPNS